MKEIWKEIPGYSGKYLISTLGRVKNTDYRGTGEARIAKTHREKGGYVVVALSKGDKTQDAWMVHRLVAFVFLKKPDGAWVVNHKDGDKTNNSVDNLEWCTYQQNILHAAYNLNVMDACPVICKETGIIYPSIGVAAAATNGSASSIQEACVDGHSFRGTHWAKISKTDYFSVKCKYA